MDKFRDAYLEAKNGTLQTEGKRSVAEEFFSRVASPNYHAILAYGLVNKPDQRSLDHLIGIVESAILMRNDSILKAALTVLLLNWELGESFLQKLIRIFAEIEFDDFDDSAIVLANWFAVSANYKQSNELLSVLSGRILNAQGAGRNREVRTIGASFALAMLGPKSTNAERERLVSGNIREWIKMRFD
jgi:hypothetical protein